MTEELEEDDEELEELDDECDDELEELEDELEDELDDDEDELEDELDAGVHTVLLVTVQVCLVRKPPPALFRLEQTVQFRHLEEPLDDE